MSIPLETLETTATYELGSVPAGGDVWLALYPVFVRGEAYLAAHQGKEAAAEFQKILDHRGVVANEPIGALARISKSAESMPSRATPPRRPIKTSSRCGRTQL